MAGFALLIFRHIWNLCDEVFDEGDSLLIRKGREEWRVPLGDITNIDYQGAEEGDRIVVSYRAADGHGTRELTFVPKGLQGHAIASNLKQRIGLLF